MSTFGGIIQEIPSISVDRFDGENVQSSLFFLSHVHLDHTVGLSNPEGLPGPLYLSHISAVIIRKQYHQIKDLVVLVNNVATPIKYTDINGDTQYLTVTTLPAFHCPGSVMFLFEKDDVKVLYTGDFRISKRHLKKMTSLKDSQRSPIAINKMYIDSTFLSKIYPNFPDQFRSAKAICEIIEEWLSKSSKHVISLKMPARYGYEFLFKEISKRTKRKIHINCDEMENYRYIPELDNIFTTLTHQSQIHACFDYYNKNGKYLSCCPELEPSLIRVIKPTAMIWKEWQINSDLVIRESDEHFRVCYSNHSSLSEITDFLMYLKPKEVDLNVIPHDIIKKQTMFDELAEIMLKINKSATVQTDIIPQSNWDNLSKISKIHFKCSNVKLLCSETKELVGPPKRKKM